MPQRIISSTHRTSSIHRNTRHQTSTSGTPPRVRARRRSGRPRAPRTQQPGTGSGRRHCAAALCGLGAMESGGGGGGSVASPAGPLASRLALAPPAHTHVPSHTLALLAQAPMPRCAVFANTGPPGVSGYAYAY
ncbi:hypothetical protein C8J57DRAFT_1514500 [Mycena rebaudengoi]|nr:hypothetical protein C8J57DRAFT_1514500 [Mycena rebaudengoi]